MNGPACPPLRLELPRRVLAKYDAVLGASSRTVVFDVLGFNPSLVVGVGVWWRSRTSANNVPTTSTWAARALARSLGGDIVTTSQLWSGRALNDGWSFNTVALGARFTCTLTDDINDDGDWIVGVDVCPLIDPRLCPEQIQELYSGVQLIAPADPQTVKA